MTPTKTSRGADLAKRLTTGQKAIVRCPGSRSLSILKGVTPQGIFTQPMDKVLSDANDIFVKSGRIYRYGSSVVAETGSGERQRLITIAVDGICEPQAEAVLANFITCEQGSASPSESALQFGPKRLLIEQVLHHEPSAMRLPAIRTYATRPLFDEDYNYCQPGWNSCSGYLIHSPVIAPILPACTGAMPPKLNQLLADFSFRERTDQINAVGLLLTGLLCNLFVESGKALAFFDGNQPGVGKTLLARTIGLVLDGLDPDVIPYTSNDEELGKRICAGLRDRTSSSVVCIDNAKLQHGGAISSPLVESSSVAPELRLRILGRSQVFARPNNMLWVLTMNSTQASPDIVSRSLTIRLKYDGDPGKRDFSGRDPLKFAKQHRNELLGELAGMVMHWNQQGRKLGAANHRLSEWAQVISGILDANGLTGFLANRDEAAAEFNSELDVIATLAEESLRQPSKFVQVVAIPFGVTACSEIGLSATELSDLFGRTNVLGDAFKQTKSQKAKSTLIGRLLSTLIGRTVSIEHQERTGKATLRSQKTRSRQQKYYIEVQFDPAADAPTNDGLSGSADPIIMPATSYSGLTDPDQLTSPPIPSADGGPDAAGNSEVWE